MTNAAPVENPVRKGDIIIFTCMRRMTWRIGHETEQRQYWRITKVHSATRDGYVKRVEAPGWGHWEARPSEILTLSRQHQTHAAEMLGREFDDIDALKAAIKG